MEKKPSTKPGWPLRRLHQSSLSPADIEADFSALAGDGRRARRSSRPTSTTRRLCFVADHGPDGEAAKLAARARRHSAQRRRRARGVRFLHAVDHRSRAADGRGLDRGRCAGAGAAGAGEDRGDAVARRSGASRGSPASLRERVATLLSKPQARRFYEDLVTGDRRRMPRRCSRRMPPRRRASSG